LVKLAYEIIKDYDVTVLCGHRSNEEQDEAVEKGHSKAVWPTSKHNTKPSVAIDIAPWKDGGIPWDDIQEFYKMATIVLSAANRLGIEIKWGGHFRAFFDGPHFELDETEV
jgi:hypothetical protein